MVSESGPNGEKLARLFDVLELLVMNKTGMTVTQISNRLSLPISSTHNLLQKLVAAEVIVQIAGPRYTVGSRLVRLAIRTMDGMEIGPIARRHLQELSRTLGDDVYLAVRLGTRVVYVERIPGNHPVTVGIRLGQSLFLHATAVGKLFAANNPQLAKKVLGSSRPQVTEFTITDPEQLVIEFESICEAGFAVSREESIQGIIGVAIPIMNASAEIVAAIHISALRAQMDADRLEYVVAASRDAARAIERGLGR